MPELTTIADGLADGAVSRLLYRATRTAAPALEEFTKPAFSLEEMPLTLSSREAEAGLTAKVLVSKGAEADPELFYGPFLQLGTYLELGPTWLEIAVDIATDPLSWAIPGTGGLVGKASKGAKGLTAAGKRAKLITALAEEAGAETGEAVANQLLKTLKSAGQLASDRGRLFNAARRGTSEFSKTMKEILATADVADEIRPLYETLAKERGALADLIDSLGAIRKQGALVDKDILQTTAKGLRATGQANPFLRLAVPDVKNPLNLARQMLGIGYRGERFVVPFSALEFGAGVNANRGARIAKAGGKVFEREQLAGAITADDAFFMGQHQVALLGTPLDKAAILHTDTGLVNESLVNSIFKKLDKAKQTPEAREQITKKLLDEGGLFVRRVDERVAAQQHATLDALLESTRPLGLPGLTVEQQQSQLRRWHDVHNMSGIKMAMEANNPALAVHARVAAVDLIANRHAFAAREVLNNAWGDKHLADEFATVLRFIRESPELFEKRAVGTEERLFLKKLPEGDSLFANRVQEAMGTGTGKLMTVLQESGVPLQVEQLITDMGTITDLISKAKIDDLLAGKTLLTNYFHRLVRKITKKGEKYFKSARTDKMHLFVEDLLDGKVADAIAADAEKLSGPLKKEAENLGKGLRTLSERVKQGKIKPLEARKLSDELAARMERLGLIEYEKDSITTFAAWQSALGRADASNLIVRDFGEIAGDVNWNTLPEKYKELLTQKESEGLKNFYTRGEEPPARFRGDLYKAIDLVGNSDITTLPEFDEFLKIAENEVADLVDVLGTAEFKAAHVKYTKAQQQALEDVRKARLSQPGVRAVREGMGTSLHGKMSIRAKRAGGKEHAFHFVVEGERVPFDKSWITESGPELPRSMADRTAIEKVLRSRETTLFRRAAEKRDAALKKVIARSEKAVSKAEKQAVKEMEAALRAGAKARLALREPRYKFAEDALKRGPTEKVWVRADYAERIKDVLKAYSRVNEPSWMRTYDEINYKLKSLKLGLDIFHYNVLAIAQFVGTGPGDFFRLLVDPNGRLLPGAMEGAFGTAAGRAAVASPEFAAARKAALIQAGGGAVAGAGVGATMTDDPTQLGTFSLVGALYGAALGAARLNATWANRFAMNPQNNDTLLWMARGLWTGRPDDRAIGGAERMLRNLAKKIGVREIPGTGALETFSKELWETLHNGSKHFYFATRWGQYEPKLRASAAFAKLDDVGKQRALDGLAREIMQSGNNAFGGQNWATILEHPQYQYFARKVLLAPDWTSSRLQIVGNMFLNMKTPERVVVGAAMGEAMELAEYGFDPEEIPWRGAVFGGIGAGILGAWSQRAAGRLGVDSGVRGIIAGGKIGVPGAVMRREATKMVLSALLGGYAFMNALNYAFTGHFMWDNEDGHKLHIQMPGETGRGGNQYVGMGKSYMEAFEFAGITERKNLGAVPIVSRLRSKASVPVGAVLNVVDNKSFFGEIFAVDDTPLDFGTKVASLALDTATPIFFTRPERLIQAAFKGQAAGPDVGGAAIGTLGFPVYSGRPAFPQGGLEFALPTLVPPSPLNSGLLTSQL